MNVTATIVVAADGTVSGRVPDGVPAGEHRVLLPCNSVPKKKFSVKDMPIHSEPWDDTISLRREDMYDDDGRLR